MRFAVGEAITFADECASPYVVQAIDRRYAILTRPMTAADAEDSEWEDAYEGEVMYTIVDSKTWMRGPNNLVLNCFDYKTREGCEESLQALANGEIELSGRRGRSVPALLHDNEAAQV